VIKEGHAWRCECPDHRYRNVVCKHTHAVVFFLTLGDRVESYMDAINMHQNELMNNLLITINHTQIKAMERAFL
jgi:uncharacterized Zn finger protein